MSSAPPPSVTARAARRHNVTIADEAQLSMLEFATDVDGVVRIKHAVVPNVLLGDVLIGVNGLPVRSERSLNLSNDSFPVRTLLACSSTCHSRCTPAWPTAAPGLGLENKSVTLWL